MNNNNNIKRERVSFFPKNILPNDVELYTPMGIYITVYLLFFIVVIFAEEELGKNGCNNIWLGESAAFSFFE